MPVVASLICGTGAFGTDPCSGFRFTLNCRISIESAGQLRSSPRFTENKAKTKSAMDTPMNVPIIIDVIECVFNLR
jgi:hypothetical protein